MAQHIEVETTKMSTRGQVIIPKEIRDYLSAEEGTLFTVAPLDQETLVMKKINKEKLLQEFRNLRKRTMKMSREEILDEIKFARKEGKGSS